MMGSVRRTTEDRTESRHGAILVATLICLMLISLLLGSILKTTVMYRRQVQRQDAQLQAVWLAESGFERAAAKLRSDPAYAGETWELPAELLDGRHAGEVVIRIEAAEESPSRNVTVTARYPAELDQSIHHTLRATINVRTEP